MSALKSFQLARSFLALALLLATSPSALSKALDLPPRPANAPTGSALAKQITDLSLEQREQVIWKEVISGNVPTVSRELVPITSREVVDGKTNSATFLATADYLAIGSDADYLLIPLTPFTAQKIADRLNCSLPTPKIVNLIYSNAVVKLTPSPIPPGPAMVTVPVFVQHNETVRQQRNAVLAKVPAGALTAGHKKDIVISNKLLAAPGKVAIYGWHKPDGLPIQPVYTGHTAAWADYSHGTRLISKEVMVNGATRTLDDVLADATVAKLLSDEGVMKQPRYVLTEFPKEPTKATPRTNGVTQADAKPGSWPGEEVVEVKLDPGVRVQINAPLNMDAHKKLLLIFYALPNGNTIEQTVGKEVKAEDDWHFNIQHIAAQTRFLRERLTNENIVVAYLENSFKSWPSWRKTNSPDALLNVVETVKKRFPSADRRIVMAGHSGGGSFVFGYLNTQEKIPDEIERIAFLDANYGYETALHHDKLAAWLKSSPQHFLNVLAYHDNIALLNGKTFVSAAGGTWGRSHLMLDDFGKDFALARSTNGSLEKVTAIEGRFEFLLMENPDKKILHTVQVERNGFIQIVLAGTPLEGKGYEYFGERAYSKFIAR